MKSKVLNIRISDVIYAALAKLAAASDRSVSQICRYAIASLNSDVLSPSLINSEDAGTSTTVSFRITEADLLFINQVAVEKRISVSDVVRYALVIWLEKSSSIGNQNILAIGNSEVKIG